MERNVICIKWGDKFGPEYVNSLYKMVEKNLTLKHRFICFTDRPEGIVDGVEIRPLPELNDEGLPEKAWKKLGLFTDKLADLEGEALFLDLDIVIRDNIDCFFRQEGEFYIIKDWDFPDDIIGNSSVFKFNVKKHKDIIENFYKEGKDIRKRSSIIINDEMLIDLGHDSINACNMYGIDTSKIKYLVQTHSHPDHFDGGHFVTRWSEYATKNLNHLDIYCSNGTAIDMNHWIKGNEPLLDLFEEECKKDLK